MTKADAANRIEAFLLGNSDKWDWDEFISLQLSEPNLDAVRRLCANLPEIDPPTTPGHYCGERGLEIMANLVKDLRSRQEFADLGGYME